MVLSVIMEPSGIPETSENGNDSAYNANHVPDSHYDVIIVGGGPSGSMVSNRLSGHGLSILCIEYRNNFEFCKYHTSCGECISESGAHAVGLKDDEIRNRISLMSIEWPGNVITEIRVKGYIIDRCRLIERLKEESEAEFITGKVTEITETETGYEVTLLDGRHFTSEYIVGADGAQSPVRRLLFGSSPSKKIPITMFIRENPVPENKISFKINGPGRYYSWEFPSGNGSTVGAISGCISDVNGEKRSRTIPIGWINPVKGKAILVGDAAGFVNPISFGGLRIAFETALHAADAILNGNPDGYAKWWNNSRLSDRRFMDLSRKFASFDDNQYEKFSKHLKHGLWRSGIISVFCNPSEIRDYIGCLMALKYGW